MADYIYLLETRLSKAQRAALDLVREVARNRSTMLFLVGGAVRDLTSGSPVRDLDVVVQSNALKMKKDFEKAGGTVTGEYDSGQALFLSFPGGVAIEVGSTLSSTFPKPGKPVFKPGSLQDDLRRRDFTANAMALSLNEGSYGLLIDPLNGVADIENRELRLVSNYGFIEDPARMIRAARLMARLGWTMEEKTQARYETGKAEGYISAMGSFPRGYELEEVFHEEDPLRVLRRLEEEGWMTSLFPALTVARANVPEMERLRENQTQLQVQGIHADASAANFPLLTAKLSAAELSELKSLFPRPGFVAQVEHLDAEAKEFTAQLLAKTATLPSQAYQLIHATRPEAVLWAAHTSKSAALQAKLKSFYGEWPQARQRIPYLLMQEMRIVPELPGYVELVESLFHALMDGRLATPEEQRAFLEPHSPPAPPPPVHLRRPRAAKKDAKAGKGRKKAAVNLDLDEDDGDADPDEDSDAAAGDSEASEDTEDSDASDVPDDSELPEIATDNTSDGDDDEAEGTDDDEIAPMVPAATAKAPVKSPPPVVAATPAPETPVASPDAAPPAKTRTETPTKIGNKAAPAKVAAAPPVKAAPVSASPAKIVGAAAPITPVKAAAQKKAVSQKPAPVPAKSAASAKNIKTASAKKTVPAPAPIRSSSGSPAKGASGKPAPSRVTPPVAVPAKKAVTVAKKAAPPAKAPANPASKKVATASRGSVPAKKSSAKAAPPSAKKAAAKKRR